jgi:hypothetical protein
VSAGFAPSKPGPYGLGLTGVKPSSASSIVSGSSSKTISPHTAGTRLASDGRSVHVPLAWYPRLAHGLPADRQVHQLIGRGLGIHWPELDEDISLENILQGRASGESEQSFTRWTDWYAREKSGTGAILPVDVPGTVSRGHEFFTCGIDAGTRTS